MLSTQTFTGTDSLSPGLHPAPVRASAPASPAVPAWPIGLLGVPFDHLTKAAAVTRIGAMIATRRPHYVVTANVDFLVQARSDVELHRILLEADLVLCDGTPLLWAARWLGNPLPERAAGSDVVPLLIRAAADQGQRIFLLGAAPGVAAAAAEKLQRSHPALVIAGHYSPPFRDLLAMDSAEIIRRVQAARPDIVLVSFGCPKQEKWIARHCQSLGVPVLIGVGATLDFIAGRMKRAPAWMQRTGTECLFRMAQEPRRLARRYAGDLFVFAPAIALQYLYLRTSRQAATRVETMTVERSPDGRQIGIAGNFSAAALQRAWDFFEEVQQAGADCQLDLSQVRRMDSTGAAVLMQWRRRLHRQGRQLMLLNPSAGVRRTLKFMRLTQHFRIVADATGAWPAETATLDQPVIPPYPGGHTLAWQGEITAANAETVWRQTRQHLIAVGPPPRQTFIIDLSGLRFIDSTGAELMKRLQDWVHEIKLNLWFPGCRPEVRNVLRFAKLANLLEVPRP